MKKLLILTTALFLTACCQEFDEQPTPKMSEKEDATETDTPYGLGMNYRGRPGVAVAPGLVVTGRGVSPGFGF